MHISKPFYWLLQFIFVVISIQSFGQDPQLSQYYNAPLYMNPAFAGTGNNTRLISNYRLQWMNINAPFSTFAASFDHDIENAKTGVGAFILRDRQGTSPITTTEISAIVSHEIEIDKIYSIRPAIQTSFVTRNTDYSDYTFSDQMDISGNRNSQSRDIIASEAGRVSYLDFSAGGVLYSKNMWIGLSAHHTNTPNQSVTNRKSELPIRTAINAGKKILINYSPFKAYPIEKSITPTFIYKNQGKFDQLDLGVYGIYAPIMVGVWYRGIPIKKYNENRNSESVVLLAGVKKNRFTFCYSYDLTLSRLTLSSGGSHEVALIYEWKIPYKNKIRKRLPCPYL